MDRMGFILRVYQFLLSAVICVALIYLTVVREVYLRTYFPCPKLFHFVFSESNQTEFG